MNCMRAKSTTTAMIVSMARNNSTVKIAITPRLLRNAGIRPSWLSEPSALLSFSLSSAPPVAYLQLLPNGSAAEAGLEHLADRDYRRPHHGDEQRRQNEEHQRKQHLERRGRRLLLNRLAPLHAQRLGVDFQHVTNARSPLLALDHRGDERPHLFHSRAVVQSAERLLPRHSRIGLPVHNVELVGELGMHVANVARNTQQRGVQTDTRLDAHHHEVERVGDAVPDRLLAMKDTIAEEPHRQSPAGQQRPDANEQSRSHSRPDHEWHHRNEESHEEDHS